MGIRVVVTLPFTVSSFGCVSTATHAYLEASVNSVYSTAGSGLLDLGGVTFSVHEGLTCANPHTSFVFLGEACLVVFFLWGGGAFLT